ncbi:hypothetical protein BT69DRAFT_1298501 [Atractiella rhizophila]|nr:hypothetical protein BT69DRAFT_1298501 [Atractiella rhizophila]
MDSLQFWMSNRPVLPSHSRKAKFLPIELVRHVLSFLATNELVPASLACRAWNRCAESFMYSSLSLSTSIATTKLAATLESRIYLTHWGRDHWINWMRPTSLGGKNLLEISLDETGFQHRKEFINSTNLLGYCLALPNLQKLSVTRINLPPSLSYNPTAPLQRLTWTDYALTPILATILHACRSTLLRLHLARLAMLPVLTGNSLTHDFRLALRQLHNLEEFTFASNPYSTTPAMDNLILDVPKASRRFGDVGD